MAADEKWYFTKEQLQNTPSRRCGFDADKELSYRQQAANFIQDMGQKLQVSQLCINTAIVYMHRFYMFHSFTHFPWNTIAAASFFLAAKVEEQPRKLEHVIRIANHCLHRDQQTAFDAKSEQYAAQSQDLVFNENVLLQTLGFDVAIDHPHTHVVRCCHLVRASKDLAQTSYFMASNSLHLTTMCLQYKPTVVACFCIHLACKWSNWQIPKSNEGKDWFYYVDKTVTSDLLEQLTAEFLKIFDKCPSRLKRKISSITTINQHSNSIDQMHAASCSSSPFDPDSRKLHNFNKEGETGPTFHSRSHHDTKPSMEDSHKKSIRPHDPTAAAREREYREKKERERQAAVKASAAGLPSGKHMQHHRPPPPSSSSGSSSSIQPPTTHDPNAKMKMHHAPSLANGRDRDRDRERERDRDRERERERERERYLAQHPEVKLDPNRQKAVGSDGKLPMKQHDPNRHRDRHREQPKPQIPPSSSSVTVNNTSVSASVSTKPSLPISVPPIVSTSSAQDKNSYLNKQINSTSQRHKSPFSDVKSVPMVPPKANGSAPEHEVSPPQQKKSSSLFSPEKTPPRETKKAWVPTPPSTGKRPPDTPTLPATAVVPPPLSPFGSPPPPRDKSTSVSSNTGTPTVSLRRFRTSSSSSEPELRPVVKKLDQTPGFENIIRDSKMGIKLPKVPDIIQPICDRAADNSEPSISKELKPPDIIKPFNTSLLESHTTPTTSSPTLTATLAPAQPLVNGIETDPAAISTLLKEAAPTLNHHLGAEDARLLPEPSPFAPAAVVAPSPTNNVNASDLDKHKSEHHHKSEKKKKKDKHKHKDKDKSKDEKKKKHKDKDKERHKSKPDKVETPPDVEVPLKITISKDKLQPVLDTPSTGPGLKVKISKDRLKSDVIEPPAPALTPSTLKIKISKDQIQYNSVVDSGNGNNTAISNNSNSSRKREREKTSTSSSVPPAKVSKSSYSSSGGGRDSTRQNGRSSYNKVSYQPPPGPPPGRFNMRAPPQPPQPPMYPQQNQFFMPNYLHPPPGYMYQAADPMYHQYYQYPMYATPDMYQMPPPPVADAAPPPLPDGPPPNTPPPPPPE